MTQRGNQKSMGVTNGLNQNIPRSTVSVLNTTDEVKNINDRIKVDTTPETCPASLDGN
ncbi:hypothetical protein PAECIP111891_07073 [Paenibacillus allorhizoplanae]|uniref:Uncharacterized protein n=1 Tax=Paenibacillus allorhizoplanae TaxID=2905648 RepID=A0ABN8H9B4_9BACL|nr:hypothetical protein [Paenibacillus allorhizoplanae]CAH1232704.1 hypothetical protein PAECIP111891_07073 [Paenibacillus allorhizoplanae]